VIVLLLLLTPLAPALAATEEAVLAGGCFWCLEHDLEDLPGVLDVESGYSGGKKPNPTYQEVSAGGTGYQESVRVRFDNTKLRYEALLRAYWRNIDPLDGGGQFCDRGDSYRPVIFTTSATQAVEARNSLVAAARELGKPTSSIKVMVRTLSRFWPAENYHQNYAKRNGLRYRYYRWACRRDQRLDAVWGPQARRGVRWLNGVQAAAGPAAAVAKPAPAPAAKPTAAAKPAPTQAPAQAPAQVQAPAAKPTAAAGPAPGSAAVVAGAAPSSPAAGRPAAAAGASGAGAAPGSPGGSAS
jgi:peptide-methionine (S)-S-oxide reductase